VYGKTIYVLAASHTAAMALRAAYQWQRASVKTTALGGVVLLHPRLYVRTPQGGEDAEYLPVVGRSRVPLYIIRPEQAACRWALVSAQADGSLGVSGEPCVRPDFCLGFPTDLPHGSMPAPRSSASFLIGGVGRIRYAVFGALAWDSPDILAGVDVLLAESPLSP